MTPKLPISVPNRCHRGIVSVQKPVNSSSLTTINKVKNKEEINREKGMDRVQGVITILIMVTGELGSRKGVKTNLLKRTTMGGKISGTVVMGEVSTKVIITMVRPISDPSGNAVKEQRII